MCAKGEYVCHVNRCLFPCLMMSMLFLGGCRQQARGERLVRRASATECSLEREKVCAGRVDIRPAVQLCEAKLVDVPIPLGAQVVQSYDAESGCEGNDTFLSYRAEMRADELTLFYRQQMEQMGWQQTRLFCGPEKLISFKKPDKRCAISIRPQMRGLSEVTIFLAGHTRL